MGRDLIKASEIRSQISQIEEFKTAVNTFRVKYGYLPGDMPPSQASQLGFFTFTGTNAGKACGFGNLSFGNNDGIISFNRNASGDIGEGESYPFWQHLSDAKLIKGSYGNVVTNPLRTNTAACTTSHAGTPTNITNEEEFSKFAPRAKIASSGIYVYIIGNHFFWNWYYYSNTSKINIFSLNTITTASWYGGAVVSTYQSYQIDSKIDDGLPTSGDVRDTYTAFSFDGSINEDPPCTTSGVTPIQYDLSPATAEAINCGIDFLFQAFIVI